MGKYISLLPYLIREINGAAGDMRQTKTTLLTDQWAEISLIVGTGGLALIGGTLITASSSVIAFSHAVSLQRMGKLSWLEFGKEQKFENNGKQRSVDSCFL